LFFTDNYNPPRFIDVTKNYLLPDGSNIDYNGNPALLREAILVIKQPPITSPTVQLITQGNQNNYLEERFISFAYRYKYANGEYSATSQWSDIAFLPNEFSFSTNGTTLTTRTSSSVTILQNAWYHVAVARTSATLYFFLNGVSAGTAALSSTLYSGNADLGIGASGTGANIFAAGYISNVRLLKGTALYTAAFTPPTQPLPDNTPNQVLLACGTSRLFDSNTATTAKTFTVTGAVRSNSLSPFYIPTAYSPEHDSGSIFFDGTGDYLSLADNNAWDFGSGNFTVEGWFNTSVTGARAIVGQLAAL